MKTIVIYSNDGSVLMTQSGEDVALETGYNVALIDVPNGYHVTAINPDTKSPVLTETPKTDSEKIAELEAQQAEDDERYVDQEYRLTLLELGITEETEI